MWYLHRNEESLELSSRYLQITLELRSDVLRLQAIKDDASILQYICPTETNSYIEIAVEALVADPMSARHVYPLHHN